MRQFRVVHLVDDMSAGGVTRFLQTLTNAPRLARHACHEIQGVRRAALPGRLRADLIVSHLSVNWRALPALTALRARHAMLPIVHVEHSYSAGFAAHCVQRPGRFHTLLRLGYGLFDTVVAVSRAQAGWMTMRGLVPARKLRVISPAVDVAPFLALAPVCGPVRKLGAIGRFDRQKGFDLLIEAFRRVDIPGASLALVGDGPEAPALRRLAAGDDRIRLHPFAADPAAVMAGLDAVAMPSRWEPYGLVALEARAAGRRLLAAQVDGLEDHIAAGATRVAGRSCAAWADGIAQLMAQPGQADIAAARQDAARARNTMEARWMDLIGALLDGAVARVSEVA